MLVFEVGKNKKFINYLLIKETFKKGMVSNSAVHLG